MALTVVASAFAPRLQVFLVVVVVRCAVSGPVQRDRKLLFQPPEPAASPVSDHGLRVPVDHDNDAAHIRIVLHLVCNLPQEVHYSAMLVRASNDLVRPTLYGHP